MSKQSKIRWRNSDDKELNRLIKNFNAKIYRVTKAHPELQEHLPFKVNKKELKGSIETRADLKRVENSLKRFTQKGAEKPVQSSRGAKATEWEVKEFKLKQRIENARRARERKEIEKKEVTSRGKGTGVSRAEMGTIRENSLKPSKKNFDNLSQKEWELAKKNIDNQLNANYREGKKQAMKANYIKGLITAGYPDSLIELVQKIPLDKFFEIVQTDQEATFDFIYDPLELSAKADTLTEVWENASQKAED